jgi:uncharacterized Zn-finger protein
MKHDKFFPEALEVVYIADDTVACDGGGPVGHPRVFLTVDADTGSVDCGYCDRRFIKDPVRAGTRAKTAH